LAAIHSSHDEFAPARDIQTLLASARQPSRLWIVDASDHRLSRKRRGVQSPAPRSPALDRPQRSMTSLTSLRERTTRALPAVVGFAVFEGTILVLLRPFFTSGALLPSLVVYRTVYYVLPLCVASVGLLADEVWQHRVRLTRLGLYADRVSAWVTPSLAAMLAFVGGSGNQGFLSGTAASAARWSSARHQASEPACCA
jgi:hypothetical protein